MKETAIYKWWQKTKEAMAPMTWRQRIDYLWTYYKTSTLIGMVFLVIVGYMVYGRLAAKDVLLGGIHANLELSDAGYSHIEKDFFQLQNGNAGKEEVTILSMNLTPLKDDEYYEMNYYHLQAAVTRFGSQKVDYILSDKVALEIFMPQEMCLDLREFFTEAELTQMEDRLIYLVASKDDDDPELEERYPVAVDVSGLPFFEKYTENKGAIYFSVAANSPNREAVRAFWEYLCAFEAQ